MPSRFKPNKKPKFLDPQQPEYLKRTIRAHNALQQLYIPDRTGDKQVLECSIYKQKFPDNVQKKLMTVIRARVPGDHFQLDDQGTVGKQHEYREALVYSVQEKVMDPQNPDTNVLSSCHVHHGYYKRPFATIKRDELGNPIDSTIQHYKNMFYLEFTPENVHAVINEHGGEYKGLALGIAARNYSEKWYGQSKYSIYNLDNFINEPFDDLLQANQKGFLNKKDREYRGAVQDYIMDKEKKRELAEKEYKSFKEKQRTKGK